MSYGNLLFTLLTHKVVSFTDFSIALDCAISSSFESVHSDINIIHDGLEHVSTSIFETYNQKFIFLINEVHNFPTNKSFDRKRSQVVIIIEKIATIDKLKESLNWINLKRNGFYLIALMKGTEKDCEKIFEMFWKENFYNVNVIISNLTALTFMPFSGGKCSDTSAKIINTFDISSRKWQRKFNFPRKFENLQGCKFIHAATVSTTVKTSTGQYRGIEVDFVNMIGKILNFSPVHPLSKSKGKIASNGQGTGPLRDLFEKKIEAASASLQLERVEALSASYPYLSDPSVLVIPPGASFSSLENLYKTFSYEVWGGILAVLVFAIVLLVLVQKISMETEQSSDLFLNMFNVFLGGSLPRTQLPNFNFSRNFLSFFMIYTLILRAAYVGKLFHNLSSDVKNREVSTVDEMMEEDFTFYAYDSLMDRIVDFKFFNRFVQDYQLINVVN